MNIYQAKYQFLHRKYITPLKIFRKTLYLNQWFSCFKDYFSFPISQHNILIFWQPRPKLAETNAESVETETRVSNSPERFLFLLLDASPMTSRASMISLPKCVGIYTKLKLVHGHLDVNHSCTSLLSFTFKNNFLNFVNNLEKNISLNVAKTIAQWEISLINLEPRFPEIYSTACDLELKVIQIEGQLQFIELEHAVLLLWIEWRIMSGVKWSLFDETITVTVTLILPNLCNYEKLECLELLLMMDPTLNCSLCIM